MKAAIAIAILALVASNSAFATNASCVAQATEKKLGGAAKDSFMQKCQKDAKMEMTKQCDAQAKEKALKGAAMTSFVNKCVKDMVLAADVKK
jgi:hypothetical protein